jgi:myo-inositol-1(or 4)-monophosphatase
VNSISANLNIMIKASEKASKVLIRDFGELEWLQTSKIATNNFVLNSIFKVEKIIIEELTKAQPNYSILSEKSKINYKKDKKNIWILDPINGVKNFSHGIPHFAISIALQSNNEIISGLIFDPIKDELFYAEKNNGSYLNNRKIRVSKKNEINECLFVVDEIQNNLVIDSRKSGSNALDLAYVAAGRYDGFFQKNLNLFNIASGIILVKEASGIIEIIDLKIQDKISIIASNIDLNMEFLKKIQI